MFNTLITHLQIFGIGFSFGVVGPCFLVCAPILVTYILGKREQWHRTLIDILIFLTGRLSAYVILGAIAGASGALLRKFTQSNLDYVFKSIAGVVSIVLGITILVRKPSSSQCAFGAAYTKVSGFGGLLALGFLIGISPCVPLAALLFEIALMSKGSYDGALYALSFGLGTFLSGLITVGAIVGILKEVIQKTIRSQIVLTFFKVMCAILLMLLGVGIIFSRYGT
ncbi:MAG: sulfite exporter TauE/SafE family protein [Candidatus Omnitrophica bacterium]|nr:sulfite exporter TauE/SafE family protein [Candidatus Omnitrophota bacterium]MCM8790776.1 sulfite exporter TauE/SafE family protein [Candidatus Omnitrophota bacterium]